MADTYCVYMHTSPSGKRYIGVTKNNPTRRWENGSGYKGQIFSKAIEKYGWDNFQHEVLLTGLAFEDAEYWERFFIAMFRTTKSKYGYNCDSGGKLGRKVTEEARRRMSESHKGLLTGEKNPCYGKPMPEEVRRKLIEANTGRKPWNYGKHFQPEAHWNYGKHLSLETRQKISEARKTKGVAVGEKNPMFGKHHTDAAKQKMSEAQSGENHWNFGKTLSEDTRNKIRKKTFGNERQPPVAVVNLTTGERFERVVYAARKYGVDRSNISRACSSQLKTCAGCVWAYEKDLPPQT